MTNTIKAWHFLPSDRRLTNGDDRLIEEGLTVTVDGPLELCTHGLHASEDIMDALNFAPGPVLCRVEMAGEIIHNDDKLVATSRKVIWMADIEYTLHEFAIWCAEQALNTERAAGREPDPRSWAALVAKHQWLKNDITDEELAAARDAAGAAARDAAWAAARDAARDAQRKQLLAMIEAARQEWISS